MTTVALIVAAGRGERAAGDVPKQYRLLGGRPVLRWSAQTFTRHPAIDAVHVVVGANDTPRFAAAVKDVVNTDPIAGGKTRQDSVRLGLTALAMARPDRVLIHDAARPFVSPSLIDRVVAALDQAVAVAPVLRVTDTLRRENAGRFETVERNNIFRAQTPQGFRFAEILEAHERHAGKSISDDFALIEETGMPVATVAGEEINMKLTTPENFVIAGRLAESIGEVRTGLGFDVHRFAPGDHVWLCGVKIPHEMKLEGHSDADAGLHALTDAILGALGAGDIGSHFPSDDPRWRGAASHFFLRHAADLVRECNGTIAHIDVTLICERPKIGPHRDAMRARIAEILGLDAERVSVKATTTDGLGFAGRGEGVAAQAVATLRLR